MKVSNEAGDNEFDYQIIVYGPPDFGNSMLNPKTAKVISGNDFETECQVIGFPAPEVCVFPMVSEQFSITKIYFEKTYTPIW